MNRIEIKAVKLHQAICSAFPNDKKTRFVSAVITAAGSGARMGGVSKQLYPINGKPCILYSLRAFQNCSDINEIIIVAKPEENDQLSSLVREHHLDKVKRIVAGGSNRMQSVKNGFLAIDPKSELVAIHDGDRPLITPNAIQAVLKDAIRYGGATAARAMTDTVKEGNEKGMILKTVPRENLYTVQTPQIFLTDMYRVSLAMLQNKPLEASDDNALIENAGFQIKLTLLQEDNIKLTFPEDVQRIERVLKERK